MCRTNAWKASVSPSERYSNPHFEIFILIESPPLRRQPNNSPQSILTWLRQTHQSSQLSTFAFGHSHPHSRLSVSPKKSRSSIMKFSMTSFALAMLTGSAVARYCTAGLQYCAPTLRKIGTLLSWYPDHELNNC
jgi:hypothetical protein